MTERKPPDPPDGDQTGEGSSDMPDRPPTGTLTRRTVLHAVGAAGALGAFTGPGAAIPGRGRGGDRRCRGRADGSSPAPGPPALYSQPASAPQFENETPWRAEPLRVSGADAYVDGEYLFQDFIYDDNGANTTATSMDPQPRPASHTFGPMTGDIAYPTDRQTYVHNAADLLEFRARLTRRGQVHYRITLNSMVEPDVTAVAIGIDTGGDGTREWGHGLGELGTEGLDHVLVTWGTGAELDGRSLSPEAVSVETERNQIDIVLPLEPDGNTWRHYLVTGLWDGSTGEFKAIQTQPDEENPGGAHGRNPPPVFNVGFRYNEQEPMATPNAEPETIERQLEEAIEEQTGSRGVGYGHWRDHAQATALAERDISRFHTDIDFAKLRRRVTRFHVPESGYINRIYASNYDLTTDGQSQGIGPYITEDGDNNNGEDVILGRLVPYALYIPADYEPSSPCPFHIHLHSLSGTYNQYASWTPNFLRQMNDDESGRTAIVMTTTGRGPGVPYDDQAELDVFEAWGDAAAAYNIDFDRVTIGGYSMGGIGTHRLASKWPDLFARGFSIAGSLGGEESDYALGNDLYKNQERIAINQRHVPLLIWQGPFDELAPFPLALKYEQHLRDLGLRHEFDFFPAAEHLTFGYLDEWGPAASFLDGVSVERSPPRITYRAVPGIDNTTLDLIHDGAYWVSDIAVDGEWTDDQEKDEVHGLVDVRSLGFGEPEPIISRYERDGTEPKPHVKRGVEWKEPVIDPPSENKLDCTLENVSAVTIWVDEAELDATQPIHLEGHATTETAVTLASRYGRETVTVEGTIDETIRICG